MQEQIGIPACFSSGEKMTDDPTAITRSGQSVFMSVYRTKILDRCRMITVTWCKNLILHGLSVSVEGPEGESQYTCKVELKPWYFWKKQGSKRFLVDVVCEDEVVLLLGNLKKEAYRKTGFRPALIDPILISRKEHVFGKKKFLTRVKFHDKGSFHEISIECKNRSTNTASSSGNSWNGIDPEMEIRIDGHLAIHVKHLQWKFRGNESINLNKARIEVYWDVHDWLFSPGLRHASFIFKPIFLSTSPSSYSTTESSSSSTTSPLSGRSSKSVEGFITCGVPDFCLFLYAWKVE